MGEMNLGEMPIDNFYRMVEMEVRARMSHKESDEGSLAYIAIGKAGIGKTQGIHGLCKNMGIGCKELRLVLCKEEDLTGIPSIVNNRTVYSIPETLPIEEEDGEFGVLILDELTSARINLRTAALQLLEGQHKLNSYTLPKGWVVVALGNGMEDGGNFQGLETTHLSRCLSTRVYTTPESWKKWAVGDGVNPIILAFVSYKPDRLHYLIEDEENQACATPRSWVTLSRIMNRMEMNGALPDEMVESFAMTALGEIVGREFAAFYRITKEDTGNRISSDDIIAGKEVKVERNTKQELILVLCESLCAKVKDLIEDNVDYRMNFNEKAITVSANVVAWCIRYGDVSLDNSIMILRELATNVKYFSDVVTSEQFDLICPQFTVFTESHANILV